MDELIRISREAKIPAEIYHLKAAGEPNWPKMDAVIAKVEAARREGLKITADMYTYTAGATGFDACVPPWARDGGYEALLPRALQDPPTRARILEEIDAPPKGWENLCRGRGPPERSCSWGSRTRRSSRSRARPWPRWPRCAARPSVRTPCST